MLTAILNLPPHGWHTAPAMADENLIALIEIITASMTAEKIFLLGKYALLPEALGEEYDLLVLVNPTTDRPMDELESFIQNRSDELSPVHATVMKLSKVNELLKAGNWYFTTCCAPGKLVYDAGTMPLQSIAGDIQPPSLKAMETLHQEWQQKANGFLEGARRFEQSREYALAAFMLHQAMEHGINAILVPLLGCRFKTHSIHKLLRFLRRFSPELYGFFPRDTANEATIFRLLQRAYIHARYKDQFAISPQQSVMLLERVEQFLHALPGAFESIIQEIGTKD